MDITSPLYDGKSLSDIFSEIHKNTDAKRSQINAYITKLVSLIRTPEDATIIGPVVHGFLEVTVKNDEHLVKIAQIAQKIVALSGKNTSSTHDFITEEEKQQLLREISLDIEELEVASERA
jgi:PDZ domain-containing secreted protein